MDIELINRNLLNHCAEELCTQQYIIHEHVYSSYITWFNNFLNTIRKHIINIVWPILIHNFGGPALLSTCQTWRHHKRACRDSSLATSVWNWKSKTYYSRKKIICVHFLKSPKYSSELAKEVAYREMVKTLEGKTEGNERPMQDMKFFHVLSPFTFKNHPLDAQTIPTWKATATKWLKKSIHKMYAWFLNDWNSYYYYVNNAEDNLQIYMHIRIFILYCMQKNINLSLFQWSFQKIKKKISSLFHLHVPKNIQLF